jgi:gamma-glutamylcyclotransferase (GGCT)/AIG2-like uncharacterized protein YtfP
MNLFVYGSLMFDEVWERVAGTRNAALPARASGWEVRALTVGSWPGLVAVPGAVADGMVRLAVGPEALARLDAFEGEFYDRRSLSVETADGPLAADAWVVAPAHLGEVLPERWDRARFARESLGAFLDEHAGSG